MSPANALEMGFWSFAGGTFIGVCAANIYHGFVAFKRRQTRPRIGVRSETQGGMRNGLDKARAYAFEDVYRNYSSDLGKHYITTEEREEIVLQTMTRIVRHDGDQRLLYQQGGFSYDDFVGKTAEMATDQAIQLFEQV